MQWKHCVPKYIFHKTIVLAAWLWHGHVAKRAYCWRNVNPKNPVLSKLLLLSLLAVKTFAPQYIFYNCMTLTWTCCKNVLTIALLTQCELTLEKPSLKQCFCTYLNVSAFRPVCVLEGVFHQRLHMVVA